MTFLDELKAIASGNRSTQKAKLPFVPTDEHIAEAERAKPRIRSLLKKAAGDKLPSLNAYNLTPDRDYPWQQTENIRLALEVDPADALDIIGGSGRLIADWLQSEGLTVELKFDKQTDKQPNDIEVLALVVSGWMPKATS